MIKSWKHKGLENLFKNGSTKGVQPKHTERLKKQLATLHTITKPEDMNLPGYNFHALKGNMKGLFAVTVNANWRLTFGMKGIEVILVNYEDYH